MLCYESVIQFTKRAKSLSLGQGEQSAQLSQGRYT